LDVSQKGLDLLLEAYSKVKSKVRYPLVIAGAGPDKGKVESLIKKFRLEGRVSLVGHVEGNDKFRLISEAAFIVFPSRHEGFSLFSLEALASGSPIVSFNIPSMSWAPDGVVSKAKPFKVSNFGQLILKMERQNLRELSKRCRKVAGQYSWDRVAREFEDFFYKILERRVEAI